MSVKLANQLHPLNLGMTNQILRFLALINVQSRPNLKRNQNAPAAYRFIFWRIVALTVVRLTNEKGGWKIKGNSNTLSILFKSYLETTYSACFLNPIADIKNNHMLNFDTINKYFSYYYAHLSQRHKGTLHLIVMQLMQSYI